jgi:high affinity cGMP-specific 3',5'-cyclic phosphodiesterase 9
LDHPGFNNAYQVNAGTELALAYNDISPLEAHSAAVLFAILRIPDSNILKKLKPAEIVETRKITLSIILSTDMARHGELISKFKDVVEKFNMDEKEHRMLVHHV